MKKAGKTLLLTTCLLCIMTSGAWGLTGRDIAVRMDQVDTSRCAEMTAVMHISRGDQKMIRIMELVKKKYPGVEKQHIRFSEPAEVRDTRYLTWAYAEIGKEDDMWMFLPSEALVRRISGGGKKGAFMRSDYANEDISRREVDDDIHTLLREESLCGAECYVVEMKSRESEKTNYAKRITWVRKDIWLPAKTEYYDLGGRLIKEQIYGGYKQIQGIWTYTRQQMTSIGRGTQTVMENQHIVYDGKLGDSLFEHSNLKR